MAAPKPIPSPRAFEVDDRQRDAIEHVHGPLLVVAGAGTGKTTVLTRRIARLIREKHARPGEILAVTYTENATREMRERVQSELRGTDLTGLQVETFHAYCNKLLIRRDKGFGVLDDKDLWIYLRKRIRELHLNYFVRAAKVSQFLDDLLDFMRRCQDELVGPEKYSEYVRRLERGELPLPRVCKSKEADTLSDEEILGRCQEIVGVYATVERLLRERNLGTFGHMITRAHDLLEHDADLLAHEQARTRFILVDEFQDANFAQVRILEKLAGKEQNVFAVGDPDQAIFRFRGASSAAFALFQRQFPNAKLVALGKNRRSTTPILQCAFKLISKNPEVFAARQGTPIAPRRSPLISAREQEAASQGRELASISVDAALLTDKEVESSDLVRVIRERQRQLHCRWSDFAILYRQHGHRDPIVEELAEAGIPFSIDDMDVLDTPQVRDVLACLGAVVSENDGASLFRVAALPQFAIDPEALRAGIRAIPRDSEAGVASVLRQMEGGAAVLETLQQARDEIARLGATGRAALEGIIRHFHLDVATPPVAALLEFVSAWEGKAITHTKQIGELLEYLEYFREAGGAVPITARDENAVRLMTAHAAKGLEFKHVFILRANSNSFPGAYKEPLFEFPRELRNRDSVALDEDKSLHDQEERRLFYVAMTRACDSLTMYARQGTGKDKTPAGLLRDLVKDANLGRWLRQRQASGFQTDLFGEVPSGQFASRTSQWIALPPAADLSARLSATAVQTYETCPLQFKLEREWKIPSEVPGAMQYGAAMHRVLRSYYESVRLQRPLPEETLLDLFRADLAQAGFQDRYQYELYEKQGIEQLKGHLIACQRLPEPKVLHTEEFFEVRVGDTVVVGRIDRVDQLADGRVVIIDYKTGRPQSQEDADESLQLSIYALAAREKWGYDVGQVVFYNLEENAPVVTQRSAMQLDDARRKVEEVARAIAAGKFDPQAGFYCKFCAFRNLCPETEKRIFSKAPAGKKSQATGLPPA